MKTNVLPLFRNRLREAWSFQWRSIRMAVDWVIAIYFIVPAAVLFAVQYSSWWAGAPNWIGGVPVAAAALLLYVVAASGQIRLFVRQAASSF
ncbi:ABC transporter permease [Paenibacillus thermotolerans]|uniref:ABC transporter permease n=1 Tax=Paenibacillus thermotolerans TaxID=3027807 RepID=UPI0023681DA6|nr:MULTISPECIES: ABC transporter permease [unclassified Paenibacillus]